MLKMLALAMLVTGMAGAWAPVAPAVERGGKGGIYLVRRSAETEEETPDKSAATPHFFQRAKGTGFAEGGKNYCGPVAVANALVCLSRQGAQALANAEGDFESMTALIEELASADYCATDPVEGTTPAKLLSGVRAYVEAQGYTCQLEYKGWRPVGAEHSGVVRGKKPDTAWLARAVAQPFTAVWLNVGWYVAGQAEGEYRRTGGHWVCLVTCDDDTAAAPQFRIRNSLLNKTSAEGGEDDEEYVQLTLQEDGEQVDPKGVRRPLAGTFAVEGPGLPVRAGISVFVDAAVVMRVRQESAPHAEPEPREAAPDSAPKRRPSAGFLPE